LKSGLIDRARLRENSVVWRETEDAVLKKHPSIGETQLRLVSISTLIGRFIEDLIATTRKHLNEYEIRSLDDVREVNQGFECGIGFESFNDIKESDVIEAFGKEQVKRTLQVEGQ